MEQDLPIDIHTNKLLDWLISRRHCNKDWKSMCQHVRESINSAIQEMPAVDEIINLLSGTFVTYFHCLKIIEILKNTESGSKNIFGFYSSQKMKDWIKIVNSYEKDNLYLPETAQIIMRNVNYEIPSLKKQKSKLIQTIDECKKKENDYIKNANDLKNQFYSQCKQIGIEGVNMKGELLCLLKELPDMFSKIMEEIIPLKATCDYYNSFIKHTNIEVENKSNLVLINYLITNGNTSTYEFKTGDCPDAIEEIQIETVSVGTLDNGQEEVIDFGDDQSSSPPNGDFVHIEPSDVCDGETIEEEINWDLTTESFENVEVQGSKIAHGENALSVLENHTTRNIFINELLELEIFLQQRLVELENNSDVLTTNLFQNIPELSISTTSILKMLTQLQYVLKELQTVKLQHLCLICNSPKYVDRLTETLHHKLNLSNKMLTLAEAVTAKRNLCFEELQTLEPKIELIIGKTKFLQKEIEKAISLKYKGRPVNIIGEINLL